MKVCVKCGKSLKDESLFCPYCGTAVENKVTSSTDVKTSQVDTGTVEKQVSKKTIRIGILIAIVIFAIGTVVVCESKISKAKRLYAQSEYWKAYMEVKHIPSLGREDLIRIKTASLAGSSYHDYLLTKRIQISGHSYVSWDTYEDAFFDLVFGLYIDLREINKEPSELNAIERDEYQKFIDLFYSELSSMFNMSKAEADKLVERFNENKDVDKDKDAANEWLQKNFF